MEKAATKIDSNHTYRYERKFQVRELSVSEIESIVRLHPASFCRQFPTRIINNIYFDTRNLNAVIENIEGIAKRLKTRIRWYGESFGKVTSPVLELKIKNGFAGRKKYFSLEPFSLNSDFTSDYFRNHIKESALPENIKRHLDLLLPILLNNYTRQYYLSKCEKFRLTIDNQLYNYRIGERFNSFKFVSSDRLSTILELKYDVEDEAVADTITKHFPLRVTKYSKYINGVQQILML